VRAARDRRFKYVRNYRPDLPHYQDIDYRRQMAAMQDILRLRDEGRSTPSSPSGSGRRSRRRSSTTPTRTPTRCATSPTTRAYRPHLERLRAALDGWLLETGDRPGRPEVELVERCGRAACSRGRPPPAIAWRDGRCTSSARPPARRSPTRWTAGACAPATGSSTPGPFEARSGSVVTASANRLGYAPGPEVRFVVP
jgi:N-sulfoglucosamine sulfohydrolase